MGFKWFSRQAKKKKDTRVEFSPGDLRPGFILDYELHTYQVVGVNHYRWEDGSRTREWILRSAAETIYLEAAEDDLWLVSRTLPRSELDDLVYEYIEERGEPPRTVRFRGVEYHLDEDSAGEFLAAGKEPGKPFIAYDYEDPEEDHLLTIEQWDDHSFTVSFGEYVEGWKFSNILPGELS